jgi:hypothetical protein
VKKQNPYLTSCGAISAAGRDHVSGVRGYCVYAALSSFDAITVLWSTTATSEVWRAAKLFAVPDRMR